MKRGLLLFLTLFLLGAVSQAQVYLKAYTGYSVSANPQKLQSTEIVGNVKNVYQSKIKTGEGMNLGLAIGYRFNKNFSFEITSNTQAFTKKIIFIPHTDFSNSNHWTLIGNFGNINYKYVLVQLAPQLVYTVDYNKKLLFYLKAGPDLLMAKGNYEFISPGYSLDSSWTVHPSETDETEILKGGINIGLQSSAGFEYKLSKDLYFTCEFISVICNYKFKTIEITKYNIDGADHLNDLTSTTQKNTSGTKNDFSSWGINMGIKYFFKKKP